MCSSMAICLLNMQKAPYWILNIYTFNWMGENGGGIYGKIGNTVLCDMGSNKRWGDKFVGHCIKL